MPGKYYLLKVNVIVSQQDDKPILELRRKIKDISLLKVVVSCILHQRPIMIIPSFSDNIKGVSSLQEKGIISYDKETGKYKFNI